MISYCVSKIPQFNGDHEVHTKTCIWAPLQYNQLHLGEFTGCHNAVEAAKKHYPQSNGCAFCCPACHTA